MVKIPIFFGIVCKKSAISAPRIDFVRLATADCCKQFGRDSDRSSFDEDENLASWSGGMNHFDLDYEISELLELGLVKGVDFVITSGRPLASVPWLLPSMTEHGVSLCTPEEWAAFRMGERSRLGIWRRLLRRITRICAEKPRPSDLVRKANL